MLNKLIISLVQILITLVIKVYLMQEITLTGQAGIDKTIFSIISVILIVLTIKNFIDISIAGRERQKLSAWLQLVIFVALMGVASVVWYLMNFYIFWVFVGAFVLSFIIVFCKRYKELNAVALKKRKLKKALKYNYGGIAPIKLHPLSGYSNQVFRFGESGEYCCLVFALGELEKIADLEDYEGKKASIVKNDDSDLFSQVLRYQIIVFECDSSVAVKIYNKILKQINN